ncbi:MAG: PAS domain S-box protein [Gammaproteobacteria bacterium]|nr:PAS domain S-box protein [Gammaproteobacteria bacterium]
MNIVIYLRGKRLVQYQFNRLKETSAQLEAKTIRAKENEQRVILESKKRYEQQNKLESVLNSTVDAIITITADGIVDSFNKSAETMFGYPAEAVMGQNIKMLMPEPFASQHDSYLARYQETGEKRVIGHIREVVGKRIDGSEFPIRLAVNEVKDIEPKLYTGIIRDITDRKKMEAKLQQTLTDLTKKQAEMEEEERIARHVFENITASNNAMLPDVSFWCEPMATFSGDMMLSAILPSGHMRILLCAFYRSWLASGTWGCSCFNHS